MCDDIWRIPLDMFYTLQKRQRKKKKRLVCTSLHIIGTACQSTLFAYITLLNGKCSLYEAFRICKTI